MHKHHDIFDEEQKANPFTSYEVARAFVQNKARVIMINRKEEQGNEAISKIKQEVGEQAQIEWLPCDLGSLNEVKNVFTRLREKEKRLDLVSIGSDKKRAATIC